MWTPPENDNYSGPQDYSGPRIIPMNYPQGGQSGFSSFLNNFGGLASPQQRRQRLLGGLAQNAGQGGFMGGLGTVAKFFL